MGARLQIDITDDQGVSYVKLSGIIDEDNDLSDVTDRITNPMVVIHTGEIERINSCGVRDWVKWLGDIEQKGARYCFVECSPAIMSQVNLVNNFVGSGQIVTFYAPYFCASCNSDKMLLIDAIEASHDSDFSAPTCRCDECDHTMEFDDIESSYFAFFASMKVSSDEAAGLKKFQQHSGDKLGTLRSRATQSFSSVGGPGTTPASDTTAPSLGPTTPSSSALKGLLTNSTTFGGHTIEPKASPQTSSATKLLYLILALLAVAIGLLGYVVVQATL